MNAQEKNEYLSILICTFYLPDGRTIDVRGVGKNFEACNEADLRVTFNHFPTYNDILKIFYPSVVHVPPVVKENVHTRHCCVEHGCKYSDPSCPVFLGYQKQEQACEGCYMGFDYSSDPFPEIPIAFKDEIEERRALQEMGAE